MAETDPTITASAGEAEKLLKTTLSELRAAAVADERERIFFPSGIELISITISVGQSVKLELKVAGEKGLAGLYSFGPGDEEEEPIFFEPNGED